MEQVREKITKEQITISKYFKDVIFDEKLNFTLSANMLKQTGRSKEIVIYENNHKFFNSEIAKSLMKFKIHFLMLKGI